MNISNFLTEYLYLSILFWLSISLLSRKKESFFQCLFFFWLFYCNLPVINYLDSREMVGFVSSIYGDILVLSLSYCKWVKSD